MHGRAAARRRDRHQIGAADRRTDAVWQAGEQGRYSKRLLEAALSRSDKIFGKTTEDARPQDLVGSGVLPQIVPQPAAYFIERRDGLRTTLLMLNGAVGDYTFACRLKGSTKSFRRSSSSRRRRT